MNISVVTGDLARPPEHRTLPSGEELVTYELRVVGPDDRAASVPVSWPAPPAGAEAFEVGEALLVVGRVRRRFFRSGGSTQSRTEVVASAIVPVRRRAAVRRLLAKATAELDQLAVERPARRRPKLDAQVADAS